MRSSKCHPQMDEEDIRSSVCVGVEPIALE
jgi:hypothetical protein